MLLVESDPGIGRSRFLEAVVLEAKILGFTVLKAQAADSSGNTFGVAKSLLQDLLALDPSYRARIDKVGLSRNRVVIPLCQESSP